MQDSLLRRLGMRRTAIAVGVVMSMMAAACGESDDGADAPTTDSAATEPDAAPETNAPTDPESDPEAEPDSEPENEATPDAETETPTRGGTLTYLLEAETDTWDIPASACATSCMTVMRAVADPLTILDADGEVQPFLLESYETNDDFTVHTLTMRDGVVFHDGTPADGAAVQRSLVEMAGGFLQGQVLRDLVDGPDSIVLVDDMTVELTFSIPYASLGEVLAERTGYLIAPSYWDDPDRAGALMVATGPFQMTEWTRDERTVVTANAEYWKSDAAGEPLPYLDEVVFRPIPDASTRVATMESGDADASMDSVTENAGFWSNDWDGGLVDPGPNRDVFYLLLNNDSQFADPQLRRALALCTDREQYRALRAPELPIADGPFADGALGYLEDPGFPQFDAEAGNALLDEIGRPDTIGYGTTNVPAQLLTAELFAKMWSDNCGLDVTIDQFDQSELITRAITGQFDVMLFRTHGNPNPAVEFTSWHSRHTEGLSINVGRVRDEAIDQLLVDARTALDADELDAIGQDINRAFAENVYSIWLNPGAWFIATQPDVKGVGANSLPDGGTALPSLLGRSWLTEAWVDQ